jgi:hypothetical protein
MYPPPPSGLFPSFASYIDHISAPKTWGSQVELTALCLAFDVAAIVVRGDGHVYEIDLREHDGGNGEHDEVDVKDHVEGTLGATREDGEEECPEIAVSGGRHIHELDLEDHADAEGKLNTVLKGGNLSTQDSGEESECDSEDRRCVMLSHHDGNHFNAVIMNDELGPYALGKAREVRGYL